VCIRHTYKHTHLHECVLIGLTAVAYIELYGAVKASVAPIV